MSASGQQHPVNTRIALLLSALLIVLATLWVYAGILFVSPDAGLYPWGSDTLGHVMKVEYLRQQFAEGNFYPNLFPEWYMGSQMLRYYPPLPYYVLAGLTYIPNNAVIAANWFIALCAMSGGLTWLLYRRWLGWLPSTIGGVVYVFLPDNVRVALAEGNLPRTLASALLPLAVFLLLRSLEATATRWHRIGLAISFAVIVLCHAMMAPIYAVCCTLLALLCVICRVATIQRSIQAIACMALGISLSGWWVLPSLTGGITDLDSSAMTEALAVFPLTHYLNPTARSNSLETIYIGASLLLLTVIFMFVRKGRNGFSVALTLTGLFGVLITTPGFNDVFNALPMHNLFWPLRFLGVASFMLLLALMWRLEVLGRRSQLLVLLIGGILILDNTGSIELIHLRSPRSELLVIGDKLPEITGWRAAMLDRSQLGSAASYFLTSHGHREQLYGWAYQGARTARNVAALNEAMQFGNTAYLNDRLTLLGADDVMLLNQMPMAPTIAQGLSAAGFQPIYTSSTLTLYHRDGVPRAYQVDWPALGIGRGAQNIAYLFPQIVIGSSTKVDEYSLDELRRYKTLVLSGFSWDDRVNAETLVQQAAAAGVHVVVDLTGVPEDPLARLPRFLDVWGERIILDNNEIHAQGEGKSYRLQAFGARSGLWYTFTPQGLDHEVISFDYLGEHTSLLGYKRYGIGKVWFIGINLPFHAMITRERAAIELLSELLQLPADTPSRYRSVPLEDYRANQDGYRFRYTLPHAERLLVPVAYHEGAVVTVDGVPTAIQPLENLVAFDAPAGEHTVEILFYPTLIYVLGQVITILALLVLIILFFRDKHVLIRPSPAGDPAPAQPPYNYA